MPDQHPYERLEAAPAALIVDGAAKRQPRASAESRTLNAASPGATHPGSSRLEAPANAGDSRPWKVAGAGDLVPMRLCIRGRRRRLFMRRGATKTASFPPPPPPLALDRHHRQPPPGSTATSTSMHRRRAGDSRWTWLLAPSRRRPVDAAGSTLPALSRRCGCRQGPGTLTPTVTGEGSAFLRS